MTNDEIENKRKATEIAQSVSFFWTNGEDDEKSIIDAVSLRKAIFNAVFQAMQMKDEQHAQEKQQIIEEACNWLFKNDSYAIPTNVQVDRLREHLNKMKE